MAPDKIVTISGLAADAIGVIGILYLEIRSNELNSLEEDLPRDMFVEVYNATIEGRPKRPDSDVERLYSRKLKEFGEFNPTKKHVYFALLIILGFILQIVGVVMNPG